MQLTCIFGGKKTFGSPDLMYKDDLKSKRHSLKAISIECQHNRLWLAIQVESQKKVQKTY